MSDIQKLTYPYFTDNETRLEANTLNPIIQKINDIIEKVNGGVTPTQTVATPTISISGTTATISCSTSGATIYYTTNGNTPTTSSTQYSSPITLSGACTIKAIAVKSGMNNSSVASQSYTPSVVATPVISISGTSATITCSTSGATIRYTLDGTTPTASSTQYSSPITLSGACTIKAIAMKSGMTNSSVASVDYTPASSNLITTLKNGQKANASTGAFESNNDYISTDWIDVDNVAFATLTLASSVAVESQVSGSVSASNCRIGIVFQDNAGNYHDIALANNLLASTFTAEALPLVLPVREMKKISLYSLTANASSSDTILKCNTADWNAATLIVDTLKVSGTETYGSEIWNAKAYGGANAVASTINDAFRRYNVSNMTQFMTMIKSGESVSLHTKGGSTGRAWYKYALDGTRLDLSDTSMDYNTNAYTFTADQDMFFVGTAYTAEAEQFELKITKP